MTDFGRYLPLSNRRDGDESAVSSNWSRHVGAIVLRIADALDELPESALSEPSQHDPDSVGTIARRLVRRLEVPPHRRLARMFVRAPEPIDFAREELIDRLRAIAVTALAPSGKHGIRDLSETVVTAFDVSLSTGAVIAVDPTASGAVAIARSLTAPIAIRTVLSARTLVATDAGWSVGRGPELEGAAIAIVLFLFGRTGLPVPPARSGE